MGLKDITQEQFDEKYEQSQIWLESNEKEGHWLSLRGCDLKNIKFPSKGNFSDADFSYSRIRYYDFDECDFSRAEFIGSFISSSTFKDCEFRDADFGNAILDGMHFERCHLFECVFYKSFLCNCSVNGGTALASVFRKIHPDSNITCSNIEFF